MTMKPCGECQTCRDNARFEGMADYGGPPAVFGRCERMSDDALAALLQVRNFVNDVASPRIEPNVHKALDVIEGALKGVVVLPLEPTDAMIATALVIMREALERNVSREFVRAVLKAALATVREHETS